MINNTQKGFDYTNRPAGYSLKIYQEILTDTTVDEILNTIKTNTELKPVFDELRSIEDKKERRSFKEKSLPYFAWLHLRITIVKTFI